MNEQKQFVLFACVNNIYIDHIQIKRVNFNSLLQNIDSVR